MKKLLFVVFTLLTLLGSVVAEDYRVKTLTILSVNSAITPATYDYIKTELGKIPPESLTVIRLNTPGGLVSTTKDIITKIGSESTPVVVWVSPEGASAASAGSIIASAAHIVLMSPGTNIGAATPVGLGADLKESDERRKAMNDLTALVRSLCSLRGRPSLPYEEMITKAASYTATEAMKLGIIDGLVRDVKDIYPLLEGKKIQVRGKELRLHFDAPVAHEIDPSLGQRILEVLVNPSTAYILFLVGLALVYFEFQAPGGYVAGGVGFSLLVLAAIAFQVLPLDWGAMGLIFLGVFLLILEIFVISYGFLSAAGIAAFVLGSLFLFHGDAGFITVHYTVLFSTLAGVVFSTGLVVWYLYRDKQRQRVPGHFFSPTGTAGTVLSKTATGYQVKVKGEIWNAFADEVLDLNEKVEVYETDKEKLFLRVRKWNS